MKFEEKKQDLREVIQNKHAKHSRVAEAKKHLPPFFLPHSVVSMENGGWLKNSEVLSMLSSQLFYLPGEQRQDITKQVDSFPNLFNDVYPCTSVIQHDILEA